MNCDDGEGAGRKVFILILLGYFLPPAGWSFLGIVGKLISANELFIFFQKLYQVHIVFKTIKGIFKICRLMIV